MLFLLCALASVASGYTKYKCAHTKATFTAPGDNPWELNGKSVQVMDVAWGASWESICSWCGITARDAYKEANPDGPRMCMYCTTGTFGVYLHNGLDTEKAVYDYTVHCSDDKPERLHPRAEEEAAAPAFDYSKVLFFAAGGGLAAAAFALSRYLSKSPAVEVLEGNNERALLA